MSERWICARCFTSADAERKTCPNCGTARGMSKTFSVNDGKPAAGTSSAVPAGEPAEPAEPPAPPDPRAADPGAVSAAPDASAASLPPVPPPAPVLAATAAAGSPDHAADPGERWVCRRCFVSNEGSASECANCGLLRGAEPPPDDPGAYAAAQAEAPPPGRKFPWQWVIFGVIALAVVGGSIFFAARRDDGGEITDAGTLDVQDVRVGDCFDLEGDVPESGGEISTVRAIPCEEPHIYEMYFVGDYPEGEEPSGPDEDYTAWEQDACIGSFEPYVGHSYDTSIYFISALTPTDESWDDGDRALQCFLHNEEETAVTGSAEGSAQ